MLLMLDNYDSFTYNLVQYLGELGADVRVHRNDALTVQDVVALGPEEWEETINKARIYHAMNKLFTAPDAGGAV